MAIITITPPAAEPVQLADVKTRLRIEHDDEDALLHALIAAARERVERATGRALIVRRVREVRDSFADGDRLVVAGRAFRLGLAPASVIHHVKTYAADGSEQIFAAENYVLDAASDPPRLALNQSGLWPAPGRAVAGVEIEYDAGYGATGEETPAPLREAVHALVGDAYEHRTPADRTEALSTPPAVKGLLQPFMPVRL